MRLQEIQGLNLPLTQLRVTGLELSNQNDEYITLTRGLIEMANVLSGTHKSLHDSLKKPCEEGGNLVRRAEKLKKLGAKASNQIVNQLIDRSEL